MKKQRLFLILTLVVLSALLVSCGGGNENANANVNANANADAGDDAPSGGLQIPEIEEGKFNVALVMLSNHDDGGWSQAQYEGLQYLEANTDGVHTAYMEMVAEGADSEQVFRSLSRKGFDLIIGGSFGYMDPMEVVASEFPDIGYIHISGYKANMENFGNLFGSMEDMKYLAGMLAGSRAKADGMDKVGIMATFPIPEEFRLTNAFALGLAETCEECSLEVRWIFTWHDPIVEREAADSLFDAGAHVVITGADTPAPALAAADREGVYAMTYDWVGSCTAAECMTAPYWVWGPVFVRIVEEVEAGTYFYGWDYFGTDDGGVGLYGFMDGQEMQPALADLPAEDIQLVKDTLAQMLAGEFTRFDVFAGPIMDNAGGEVIADGMKMEQSDMDQFPPGALGLECTYCMYWFNENIIQEKPSLD